METVKQFYVGGNKNNYYPYNKINTCAISSMPTFTTFKNKILSRAEFKNNLVSCNYGNLDLRGATSP